MPSADKDTAEVESPRESEPITTGRKGRSSTSGLPPKPSKSKKIFAKRAEIWKHFIQRVDDYTESNCRYCGGEIGRDSKTAGTTAMKSYWSRCKAFKDSEDREKQQVLAGDNSGNMKVVRYDPTLFRRSVNEMVVVNELPFSFVESEGWKKFCFNVLPMYQTFSRKTSSRDIASMYLEEKAKLKELFSVAKQRLSLTTNIWVSPTTSYNYMVVTGHWIDGNWQLQKRILSFKVITDYKRETIADQLVEYLEDWGIEKVFSVTVDNAKGNEKVLDGEMLHMRCCSHILNFIVGDGLKQTNSNIVAIRNAFKYVRSSYSRLKSFELKCDSEKISKGSMPLDCITRWNSTYLMLTSALKLRVAFEKMVVEDKLYCEYFLEEDEKTKAKRVGPPTFSDWDEMQRLVKFLKIFYKCTLTFSASTLVTSTLCYNEIVNIEKALITKCCNSDLDVRKQALVMRDKFEKYWDGLMNMNPLVILGSVFDPRNKMQFASLCFEQLYGKDTIESKKLHNSVENILKRLYVAYSAKLHKPEENKASDVGGESEQPAQTMTFLLLMMMMIV